MWLEDAARLLGLPRLTTRHRPLPPRPRRADFAVDMGRNIIHGSDSVESAMREVRLLLRAQAGRARTGFAIDVCAGWTLVLICMRPCPAALPQIALWFRADELADYTPVATPWIYE